MDTIFQFTQSGCFNHVDEGRFTGAYYFNIEDSNPFMEKQGFESLELIGSNIGAILNNDSWNYWRDKGERKVEKIIKLIKERTADPYILEYHSLALYG